MDSASGDVLQLEGLNELEVAEIRKAFRLQGVDLDAVATTEYPALDGAKLGDPGTAILLFSLGKVAVPLMAGVLGGWLAKPRSGSRSGWTGITWKKGELTIGRLSRSEFAEGEPPASIAEKLLDRVLPPRTHDG